MLEALGVEGGFEVLEGERELEDEDVVDCVGRGLAAVDGLETVSWIWSVSNFGCRVMISWRVQGRAVSWALFIALLDTWIS